MVPINHGKPRPKNTFTEFDPVTLLIEASAVSSSRAAVREANVSGSEVPRATKVMAGGRSGIEAFNFVKAFDFCERKA